MFAWCAAAGSAGAVRPNRGVAQPAIRRGIDNDYARNYAVNGRLGGDGATHASAFNTRPFVGCGFKHLASVTSPWPVYGPFVAIWLSTSPQELA
jgi:hypothetical protein